jgi:hypothetical protein
MKPYTGPPMTLGNAAAARVQLIVWCLDCRHRVEPDAAEMVDALEGEASVVVSFTSGRWKGSETDDRARLGYRAPLTTAGPTFTSTFVSGFVIPQIT